jgi:hypothetical protein
MKIGDGKWLVASDEDGRITIPNGNLIVGADGIWEWNRPVDPALQALRDKLTAEDDRG